VGNCKIPKHTDICAESMPFEELGAQFGASAFTSEKDKTRMTDIKISEKQSSWSKLDKLIVMVIPTFR
jgi:hypothetical protein